MVLAKKPKKVTDKRQKLLDLKDRIRKSGLPVRENYKDPKELGQLVLEDMTNVINRLYPKDEVIDPLDRLAMEHEAFAQSRTRVYIGRQEYFDRLDRHIESKSQPLVIIGKSGCGKSALIANWAMRYREGHPDDLVIMHFIGSSPYSTDWKAMVRRIMGELSRKLDIEIKIPDKPDELRMAFANILSMASAKRKFVLIIDGLNQLEDIDNAPDLVWLPPVIPENVRMILSTLPGRPMDELMKREWETLEIKPLKEDERKELIVQYLALYARSMSEDRVERIANAEQSSNPLFLRALLDELRVFGSHERKYLKTEADKRNEHNLLADYFSRQDINSRRIDEQPWQLAQAKEWKKLYELMSDLAFFDMAFRTNEFEVKSYWSQIENNTSLNKVEAYKKVLDSTDDYIDYSWSIAKLFQDTGNLEQASILGKSQIEYYRKVGDNANLSSALGNQANILYLRGELEGAMALHKEQERICRELGDKHGLAISLGNQASLLAFSMKKIREDFHWQKRLIVWLMKTGLSLWQIRLNLYLFLLNL